MMQLSIKPGPKNSADVLIYDYIGPEDWGMISAKSISAALDSLGAVSEINVRMNSGGGFVFEGLAIYNLLKNHPAPVNVHIDGAAISIASVIAMAGDQIHMAESAMLMIHDPWTSVSGSAADLRKEADVLDQLKGNLVGIYAARTGIDPAALADMMTAETWMQSDVALSSKFVDSVVPNKGAINTVDISAFKNAPAWAKAKAPAESTCSPWKREIAKKRLDQIKRGS